ncbi:MAG: saccharopine dehydrogenase NADP-binding domain-containing protein [Saprospiraceae bacterium]|nr:saccharopine dehydrogenase NADP-binding domain-containing protein [Saprospiraceae bacterium]
MVNKQSIKAIVIAGAGGIGEATAILLARHFQDQVKLFIGNRTVSKAERVVNQIKEHFPTANAQFFSLAEDLNEEMQSAVNSSSVLLDCLPGSEAPRMAQLALIYGMHYANLTEYVAETSSIIELAAKAETGFILQTGLAPGFINVLAHGVFKQFCQKFEVEQVDLISMKVGALTRHATPPHYYGFTWSPVGVATEYLMDTICLRENKKVILSSLSEPKQVIIDGITYEEDLTSGGTADLPDFFAGRVESLEYKTLRYPGHYNWVKERLAVIPKDEDRVAHLQKQMEANIPHVEDDQVIIYCAVEGPDIYGNRQRLETNYQIPPMSIGDITLRAIQVTTAAPLAECARILMEKDPKGVITQSQLDPETFLNGEIVKSVFNSV